MASGQTKNKSSQEQNVQLSNANSSRHSLKLIDTNTTKNQFLTLNIYLRQLLPTADPKLNHMFPNEAVNVESC